MKTAAYHTLGCKVNQYDTEAMRELMSSAGYQEVPFEETADVYLLNTCTVTGTGDRKSLQLARRIKREHPDSLLVLCGCLAQKKGESLLEETGADLVLGTQARGQIVSLLERVSETQQSICAVRPFDGPVPFEALNISRMEGHTRAVVKIQEGCDNRCTYCVIPSVRGPVRSRLPSDLEKEIHRLSEAGFSEIVLTGIHLASYGRDFPGQCYTLLDAIRTVHDVEGILRIRLGSLEPIVASDLFCKELSRLPKVCPQFHLALQSGSDAVLARMRRRYNTSQYLSAVDRIRSVYPRAALTTDIMVGFPGETEKEFQETCRMVERVGFSRIHVFPYSPRENTPAAEMKGALPRAVREERARELIALGDRVAKQYLAQWVGRTASFLPEELENGRWAGYTREYIRVFLPKESACQSGVAVPVRLTAIIPGGMEAVPIDP